MPWAGVCRSCSASCSIRSASISAPMPPRPPTSSAAKRTAGRLNLAASLAQRCDRHRPDRSRHGRRLHARLPAELRDTLAAPSRGVRLLAGIVTGVLQLALVPVFGALSDRIGRTPAPIAAALVLLLGSWPALSWLNVAPSFERLFLLQALLGIAIAAYLGRCRRLLAELFPVRARSGIVPVLRRRRRRLRRHRPIRPRLVDFRDGRSGCAVLLSRRRGRYQSRCAPRGAAHANTRTMTLPHPDLRPSLRPAAPALFCSLPACSRSAPMRS